MVKNLIYNEFNNLFKFYLINKIIINKQIIKMNLIMVEKKLKQLEKKQ